MLFIDTAVPGQTNHFLLTGGRLAFSKCIQADPYAVDSTKTKQKYTCWFVEQGAVSLVSPTLEISTKFSEQACILENSGAPIRLPTSRHEMGGCTILDTALPFGLRSAQKIFCTVLHSCQSSS